MSTIERSAGTPIGASGLMAGGGYRGYSAELDALVCEAASALAEAYGADVEIRFNSDRESGGAWIKTPDGYSAHVGIWAQLVTARARAVWEKMAKESERAAETGRSSWDGHDLGEDGREIMRADAACWRAALAGNPEGTLTVGAHITAAAAGGQAGELAELDEWNCHHGPSRSGGGYHHGPAGSVAEALARCLRFVPAGQAAL